MFHTIQYLPRLDVTVPDEGMPTKVVYVAAFDGNMGGGFEWSDSRADATAIAIEWSGDRDSDDKLYFFEAVVPRSIAHDVGEAIDGGYADHIAEHTAEHAAQYATNVEVVTKIMEYSKFGALSQAFVVEAISRYADQCASMTDEAVERYEAENHMLSYKAWRGVAREIKAVMDERYHGGKKG